MTSLPCFCLAGAEVATLESTLRLLHTPVNIRKVVETNCKSLQEALVSRRGTVGVALQESLSGLFRTVLQAQRQWFALSEMEFCSCCSAGSVVSRGYQTLTRVSS
jgi:hypothetical protein